MKWPVFYTLAAIGCAILIADSLLIYKFWMFILPSAKDAHFELSELTQKQDPNTVIPLLKQSLVMNPAIQGDRWWVGPLSNLDLITHHYSDVGDDRPLQDNPEYHPLIRSSQAVELDVFSPKKIPDVDEVFAKWKTRLQGIIKEDEIDLAESALREARAKGLRESNENPRKDDGIPLSEKYGKIFLTRVRTFNRSHVEIDLDWIDIKSYTTNTAAQK